MLIIVDLQYSRVNEDSILAIQIFDQKKFKKKDQGFLGVINVRTGDVIDISMGGDGEIPRFNCSSSHFKLTLCSRNAHERSEKIER